MVLTLCKVTAPLPCGHFCELSSSNESKIEEKNGDKSKIILFSASNSPRVHNLIPNRCFGKTFYPMVRYASYHSVKYMNMNENFRNWGILTEKIRGLPTKITYISASDYPRLPNVVSN